MRYGPRGKGTQGWSLRVPNPAHTRELHNISWKAEGEGLSHGDAREAPVSSAQDPAFGVPGRPAEEAWEGTKEEQPLLAQ